jgi:hypothetical protein
LIFGRRKGQLPGSCDRNRYAGRRIAALTGRAILDLELTEPGKAGLGSAYRRISDLEHAIDDGFGLSLCQVVLGCDLFGDLIGSCYGTSSVLFRLCSSDIKAVEQIEPASQAEP